MSESIVRKVQPFTIGTKLSVPAVPKGTDFADSFLPSSSLDNCKMQHNLNNQVSLYLGHSPIHPSDSHFSPMAARVLLTERCQEEKAEEDHLNRNAVSPTASSRSIKKITISSWTEKTGDKVDSVAHCPKVMAAKSENSNNNNNAAIIPPKIVGVSCESKPNSHFKVLLRKEDEEEHKNTRSSHGTAGFLRPTVLKDFPSHLPTESRAPFLRRDVPKKESTVPGNVEKHKQQSDYSLTQRITQFNREILQAETWIKGTLQDLKDGCSIQRCPLQDWEQVSQTLQRDLKDFEKTMIQLNQMGEQLICKQNPTSDTVRKQLSQLKDQWQTLKQTAANQSKALGGARNLQEFNRKVDKLESWLKGKEEKQSLVVLLEENIDKMQLTRRILDLKQDEQQYRALHDEIDSLAVRLEKQGKNEGKNISARRKHINKMWLKTQNLLKDYHEKLQLALEASSFSQQADNIIRATNNKRKIVCGANGQENSGDREMRDIASQIMMLDVTVSQLSNLHPTLAERVTQKQREVKNTWALLQQAVRNEKSGLPSPCSDFTREDGDPLTSTRELQCSMGKEVQRFMGKEVQEEQNRLKECVASEAVQPGKSSTEAGGATGSQTAREPGSNRKLAESQDEQQCSKSSPLPGTGSSPCETDDVIGRRQTDGESRRKKPEAKASLHHRYPQLQVQLQKFTVSADKTLSWLKDNVAMATQVCCAENYQSFEAAKRCQAALEDEILSNRTRIEVVKKEGRSLVRAQHPGSTKIEEFLRQLEVLWEELKKRHQKNDAVLQELEKTNLQAMTVLKDLHDMGEWLKTVESSISLCALSGDPESMNAAERESSLLENEVASRGLELRALRQEVEKLRSRRHFHKEELPSKRGEVEEKYYCVQNMLKQQTSELQDTRMLTEFLEKVEMEENQVKKRISHMSSIGQPLHSELGCHGSSMLVLADAGQQLIDSGRFDSDDIADPLEELREAVEMLNDTVRERGRSLTEDHGLEEQLRRLGDTHSNITARISRMLSQSAELSSDILKMETDMSVKCEPDLCRLENLNNQQEDMEIDFEVIKEEVDEMEKQAARLQVLYPERVQILGEQVQETLQAWEEMGKCIAENSGRLSQALQLQDFFRNYLAMISWTEDTRTCIFSESPVNPGKEGRLPETEELDTKIEQKFQEFEELAAAGQKLIDEEHHLTEIIKERTEELRSMLGWILVRWRAQKHQRSRGKTKAEPKGDVIYSEATVCTPQSVQGFSPCLEEQYVFQERSTGCRVGSCTDRLHPQKPRHSSQSEGGYEEMTPIHPKGSELNSSGGSLEGLLVLESPESPLLVLKEPSAPSLGGTVNLILSFSKKRDSQLQLQDPMDESETQEPIHRPSESISSGCKNFWRRCQGLLENTFGSLKRKKKICLQNADEVSTYLHVKDNKKAISPVFESVTLPRLNSKGQPKAPPLSEVSTVSFHTLPKTSSSSIFNSLKKRGKKKKRDVRRHTIQKIMGVDLSEGGAGEVTSNTNTWPLKERVKDPTIPCPASGELLDYVKNPLVKDIDAECTVVQSFSDFSQPGGRECSVKGGSTLAVNNNCKRLCLGSVLSFELPKDMNLIGNIPDLIKIQPPDTTADSLTINSLSSFCKSAKCNTDAVKDLVEAEGCSGLSTTRQDSIKPRVYEEISNQIPKGAQGQKNEGQWFKLHNPETDSSPFQPALPTTENPQNKGQDSPRDDIFDLKLKRLSRISILHEEVGHEWDKLADALDSTCRLSNQIGAVDEERQYSTTAANGYLQSSSELCQMGRSTYCELSNNEHKLDKKKGRFNEVSGFKSPQATSSKVKAQMTPHSGREVLSDSVLCNNVNVKTCSGEQTESVAIRVNRSTFKRDKETKTNKRDRTSSELGAAAVDVIHPDHQQFEEEEEELEDIWNKSVGYRQSICSDIMYQTYNQGQDRTSPAQQEATTTPCQDITYRKLVTASAPNLLVAEFRLPASIQNLLGYCKESDTGEKSPTSDHRRSWDAFPHKEQASRQIAPINETASDQVKLPNVADHQKYIYKYREEEEDTGSVKDQSVSLLSVHMGVEGNGKQPVYSEGMDCDCAEQGHTINTRGHCSITNGNKAEFESMEGTLERKHKLQLGGKRASCRTWNPYHAVLFKQSLCFYQDRKDMLQSSIAGVPLNLTGAVCSPAPDYTKKMHCFRLQLRDGSEYLLSAPSGFLMKKWILKIKANTGLSDLDPARSIPGCPLPVALCSQSAVPCSCSTACNCPHGGATTSLSSGHRQSTTAKTKEITVLTRENTKLPNRHRGHSEDLAAPLSSDAGHREDYYGSLQQSMRKKLPQRNRDASELPPDSFHTDRDQELAVSKRRSHSFTSAAYQKITPISKPLGGSEFGPSYSVTLLIGEQLGEAEPVSNSPESTLHREPQLIGWHPEILLDKPGERNYGSLPRPRNKSVFQKFFGKKE
ncbi:uncharacterized protein LOC117411112 isoform X3 [Acipenser ruthenus]|uniref:uncharacterized protein LOC117411112 isoform X3 n=1 Tax=Acipenser ruthenus TaxID=7906 RepID=UPI00274236B5|nr:uncharacterized protein LOC117411112 isoform X3 [Acipenser ruthenus]